MSLCNLYFHGKLLCSLRSITASRIVAEKQIRLYYICTLGTHMSGLGKEVEDFVDRRASAARYSTRDLIFFLVCAAPSQPGRPRPRPSEISFQSLRVDNCTASKTMQQGSKCRVGTLQALGSFLPWAGPDIVMFAGWAPIALVPRYPITVPEKPISLPKVEELFPSNSDTIILHFAFS